MAKQRNGPAHADDAARQQAERRQHCHRLARAGLANKAERVTGQQPKADVIHDPLSTSAYR